MMAVAFHGPPIRIEFQSRLHAWRGKLLSGGSRGTAVHAAGFLRERRIVLDRALLRNARERDRILAHEIFHFAWWRLGRAVRRSYEELLRREAAQAVRGEMGWSAQWRKDGLQPSDWEARTRLLRDYVCESFCDTAAAYLTGLREHPEITLPARAQRRRALWMRNWMEANTASGGLKI